MTDARILVLEDDPGIRMLLSSTLRLSGYAVEGLAAGREALDFVRRLTPHLLLVDVMLPDLDGTEVVRTLRAEGLVVPVVFLTGRGEPEDRLNGFRAGGDDYIVKPFNVDELLLRIRAVLRRAHPSLPAAIVGRDGKMRYADLVLDEATHQVQRAGHDVWLTATEFRLLTYLMSRAGQVIGKYQILESVWSDDFTGDAKIVEVYIHYLRTKIDCFDPPLIQTVRGVGYCLRTPAR